MIRKTAKIGFFGLVLTLLMAFQIQPNSEVGEAHSGMSSDICSIQNKTFQAGEQLTYKLYYNWNFIWLAAGEVHFKVRDLGDQFHISALGQTYPSYEWFYKVRDRYEVFINKETLLPSTSIRDVHEGKYTVYDEIDYDQINGKASSLRGDTKNEAVRSEYSIDHCMHDVLSIMYYSRNVDFENFEEGENFPIKIFMDKETWPLQVVYKGKDEAKRIKGKGKFKTIKFGPEVIAGGIFDKKTEMTVWVSDDQNRLPLLIESPLSIGHVKAVLKNYEGLKYDLTAKLK